MEPFEDLINNVNIVKISTLSLQTIASNHFIVSVDPSHISPICNSYMNQNYQSSLLKANNLKFYGIKSDSNFLSKEL